MYIIVYFKTYGQHRVKYSHSYICNLIIKKEKQIGQ